MIELLAIWLATYWLHSCVLVGLACAAERLGWLRDPRVAESAWRAALLGAMLTANAALIERPTLRADPAAGAAAATDPARAPARAVPAANLQVASDLATLTRPAAPAPRPASDPRAATALVVFPASAVLELPATLRPALHSAVLGWMAFALAGLLLLGAQWLRLRRDLRAAAPADHAELRARVALLAREAGVRMPRVLVGERWSSPLVTPAGDLCLPRWTLARLDGEQRDALLAHEIAHLRRRDPWWRLLGSALARVFWLQPLNLLALGRLDAIAERRCDDWAAARCGDGRPLAACLVACAEHLHGRGAPALVPAMARRASTLHERVLNLIEGSPMSNPKSPRAARAAIALVVLAAVLLLPIVALPLARAVAGGHQSISVQESPFGRSMTADLDTPQGRLEVAIDGDIEFTADENDVAKLDDEATIALTRDGVEHEVEFRAGSGGTVTRRYRVDGTERPFDAAARRWLAEVIPIVLRETAWDAPGRVARLQAKGGVARVLAEIELIQGNYARRSYIEALVAGGTLEPAAIDRVIALTVAIESDFERRTSFQVLVEHQDLAAAQQAGVLDGVAAMGSDFEKRTVLTSISAELAADATVVAAWGRAVDAIGSDFEARTAIVELAAEARFDGAWLQAALRATQGIGSAFERRTALVELVEHVERHPDQAGQYVAAAAGISSDFERRTALIELVGEVPLDAAGYAEVLDAVESMDSDFESRQVLTAVAERMPPDAALIKRYRQVARRLSDFERGQAEKALDHLEV